MNNWENMALLWIDTCPFCGIHLKPSNLFKHIERVHPRNSYGLPKISLDSSKCPICGKTNDPQSTKHGLSVCSSHYVRNIRRFLIKDFYLELKKTNSKELALDPKATSHMIKMQLHLMNKLLGWEPERIESWRYLQFAETSTFTGYLLLRGVQAVPEIKQIMHSLAETDYARVPSKKQQLKIAQLLIMMDAEFEFFVGIKFAASGYFDIAVDSESSPKTILIVPCSNDRSVRNLLILRLKDSNEQWHGTFRSILVPYGISTARDEFGASFSFNRGIIKDNFKVFAETWNEIFQTRTRMTASDFEKLWEWLEWVITQNGITESNQSNATHFEDHRSLGIDKDLVFEILNDVLPDISERSDLISLKELSKSDPNLTTLFKFADLSRGFKLSTSKGIAYYFPCRKWFYNKLIPVFIRFVRKLNLAGDYFEKKITTISNFYSRSGVKLGGRSAVSVMIEPRLRERTQGKTSRAISWRILEEKYPINLPGNGVSRAIGKSGEIDLIVYANMNLYLMELKALNLDNRYAIDYMRKKAPSQCARYAAWLRNKHEFEEFLKKHGIKEDRLNSVRIVICSSGVFGDFNAVCSETGEQFAILPEFVLFSAMAGLFTLSLKKPFPARIETISPGFKACNQNISRVESVDRDKEIGQKISKQLSLWFELMRKDRRQNYVKPNSNEKAATALSSLNTAFVAHETYLSGTASWILRKPLLVDQMNRYKFYVGTQLGDSGTTVVCENCKSATKFYWPRKGDVDSKRIEAILASHKCPLCRRDIQNPEKAIEVKGDMARIMSKFKYEIGLSLD